MKKLSLGLIIAISLTTSPVWASIHGGTNPKPGRLVGTAEKTLPMSMKNRIPVCVATGGSIISR